MSSKPGGSTARKRRARGLECPFNTSQCISMFLHLSTAGFFYGTLESGLLREPMVPRVVYSILCGIVLCSWLYTSTVDSALEPGPLERCFCGTLYCFKRANLKTRYCAVSRKKVPGMDHYCVWMNTPVGSRNYTGFFLTVFFSTCLFWFQIGVSIFSIFEHSSEWSRSAAIAVSVVQALYSGVVAGAYSTLLAFHIYLICSQTSTFDFLLNRAKRRAQQRKERQHVSSMQSSKVAVEVIPEDKEDG